MSEARVARLEDRGVVAVTGEDASKLLQGLLTNDLEPLAMATPEHPRASHAALLSPQGKILFDVFVASTGGAELLIDVARERAADLVKRLSLYRLRAKATITDRSADLAVAAAWGATAPAGPGRVFADPRSTALGWRIIGASSDIEPTANDQAAAYHAHRIGLGIPEGGKDYDLGDAFPHEADLDLHHGVSFDKGCYVGQEIVARMQHRGTVRKRVVRVTAGSELPSERPEVMMGDVVIGKLGSVAGKHGLALLRLDRAIEAIDKGLPITAAGIPVLVDPGMVARQRKLMAEKGAAAT